MVEQSCGSANQDSHHSWTRNALFFEVVLGCNGFRVHQDSGEALPVADPRLETIEFYKVSNLKDTVHEPAEETPPPPWRGVPPALSVYRERGHRRLAARTYEEKCTTCIWGCQMAVEMIIDHWNPNKRRYRTETFCYGPRSCPLYRSGPARKVPGRHGMSYTEEDWVDDEATSRRGPDD